MKVFTKQEAAEIRMCLFCINIPDKIEKKVIDRMMSQRNSKFIREFRRETHLFLKSFGPDKYIIQY